MNLKFDIAAGAAVAGLAMACLLGYECGTKKGDAKVAALTTQIAQNEKTIEIKDRLYATKIVELSDLKGLLDGKDAAIASLKKQLDDSGAQLLATQQLVVKWKQAYEGAANAHQTDGGTSPTDPGVTRKRVDFSGRFGPIAAAGYTLTDPAEAFLKLDQVDPLVLSVNVVRNKDGTWGSLVTSSDPNMDVRVNLAGVDPGVIAPSWYQKIWVDAAVDFYAGRRAGVGLSYHFDRVSVGVDCSVWEGGQGCGATLGYRLFK